MDKVLHHSELHSSLNYIEHVHFVVQFIRFHLLMQFKLLNPRVLGLQDVLLDLSRDAFEHRESLDFIDEISGDDWVFTWRHALAITETAAFSD